MADIEQSLQDIQQERSRLLTAKANLKTAITGKGVTVPDSAKLDEYSSFVNEIQQGGVSGTDNEAGVLVDDGNGGLMVQKLNFDGTVASDSGEPLTVDNFYLFNTGKDEPEYDGGSSGGGSMEIYKCAAVHEASAGDGYVITGAGDAVLNGTYAVTEQSDTEIKYKNENGAILLHLIGDGWLLFDDQWSQRWDSNNVDYDSAADVPSWNCYVGEYPAPTVTAMEGNPASWDGYKYDLNTKIFADTLTEGLEYKMAAPIVGKCYNTDATMSIEYVPLDGIPNENIILNYPMTDLKLNANNGFLFTDGGVPELITDGIARLRMTYSDSVLRTTKTLLQGLSEFTVSLWVNFYTMPSGEKSWIFYESGYEDYARTLVDFNRDSNNHIGFHVRDTTTGDTGTWRSVYSNTIIQANKFYHIAVVYSAEEQSLYINGALEYKGTGGAILTDSTSPSKDGLVIGPDKPSVEDITHLRVFSRALNAEQISILYNELSRIVTE